MIKYKCHLCSFEFSQADKSWDDAVLSQKCPKCKTALLDFNVASPAVIQSTPSKKSDQERDIFAEVFDKDPFKEIANFLLFLVLLTLTIIAVPLALLITSLSVSDHAPFWYQAYIVLTQLLPMITCGISMFIISFGVLLKKEKSKASSLAGLCFAVYLLSFFLIALIPSLSKNVPSHW